MKYFEIFELPVKFSLDKKILKKKYYQLSRVYHPDRVLLLDADAHTDYSSLLNEAYEVLRDDNKRAEYIIAQSNLNDELGDNKVPQDFLMEVMELNEGLMDLEMEADPNNQQTKLQSIKKEIENWKDKLNQEFDTLIEFFDHNSTENSTLVKLKDNLNKKRYLNRLEEKLKAY